jgi:alpha-glucuronidase
LRNSSSEAEAVVDVAPAVLDAPARVDETGVELKRGAFLNTIAMLASNFRGIFTFLVARLLGPAATGNLDTANHTSPSTFSRKSRDEKGRRCFLSRTIH